MILQANDANIKSCANSLSNGELVAFPTETVYGLGADATNEEAAQKIYKLKGRISTNPLIVHLSSYDAVLNLFADKLNEQQKIILDKLSSFWPGPLSVILPKPDSICSTVAAGGDTVAIRVPNHPVALSLLSECNLPIAAPSANKSLLLSPTTAQHVEDSFPDNDLLILDGGNSDIGLESTVLDLTNTELLILRPGAISAEQISELTGKTCRLHTNAKSEGIKKSPGQLSVHYSPVIPLCFIDQLDSAIKAEELAVVLFSDKDLDYWQDKAMVVRCVSQDLSYEEIAQKLYAELRDLEQLNIRQIAIERCEEKGLGIAIMDRLKRATCK